MGALSRRSLLVAVGLAPLVLTVGCTTDPVPGADAVTPAQVDQLTGQVAVQDNVVAAYAAALASSAELAAAVAPLAEQAQHQLARLRAAAPSVTSSPTAPTSDAPGSATPVDTATARATLRTQVAAAATSHADACLDFSGARAALLGSIAAGLRGQDGQLA